MLGNSEYNVITFHRLFLAGLYSGGGGGAVHSGGGGIIFGRNFMSEGYRRKNKINIKVSHNTTNMTK